MNQAPLLKVQNLTKFYGQNLKEVHKLYEKGLERHEIFAKTGAQLAVDHANFEVFPKEIFVIMGLSGSGKSTLVRHLNRLIEPSWGKIHFQNEDVYNYNSKKLRYFRRNHISMVFQSFALFPHLTAFKNVSYGLDISKTPKKEKEERVFHAISLVGLENYAYKLPADLSGGMKQRVGLARALAVNPTILLIDEAFSALDPIIRNELQDELLDLHRKEQNTIIFIGHDREEALKLADRMAIMENGKIVQIGKPEDFINNPSSPYVKRFFEGATLKRNRAPSSLEGHERL